MMKIEEMYMEILKIRNQILVLDNEISCDNGIKCSECEFSILCDAFNVAASGLNMAKSFIENY